METHDKTSRKCACSTSLNQEQVKIMEEVKFLTLKLTWLVSNIF